MKLVTFGEIMMRLNPAGYQRFVQADSFEATYAGGEANVAVSVANYGLDAAFVTKVPAHEIGQCAVNTLRHFGVDTSNMIRGGDRLGIYFVEKGASQRPSKVIYDRAHAAIAEAVPSDFNWKEIFKDVTWFHFTGITPALGGNLPEICLEACKTAKEMGVTVSCDLNFRKKLWSSEQAGETMGKLMPYVDVCIANEEDAKDVFGIESQHSDINAGKLDRGGYVSVAQQLVQRNLTNHILVDTILCMDGTRVIGTCLAQRLTQGGFRSINAGKEIYVLREHMGTNGKLIFRDNARPMLEGKNILLLMASVTTGGAARKGLECVEYYKGSVVGIAAIYSHIAEVDGIPVVSLFDTNDLPGYASYPSDDCPMCRAKQELDAVVDKFGYSAL